MSEPKKPLPRSFMKYLTFVPRPKTPPKGNLPLPKEESDDSSR